MTEIEWDKNDGNRVERKGSGRFISLEIIEQKKREMQKVKS